MRTTTSDSRVGLKRIVVVGAGTAPPDFADLARRRRHLARGSLAGDPHPGGAWAGYLGLSRMAILTPESAFAALVAQSLDPVAWGVADCHTAIGWLRWRAQRAFSASRGPSPPELFFRVGFAQPVWCLPRGSWCQVLPMQALRGHATTARLHWCAAEDHGEDDGFDPCIGGIGTMA